jgi:YidC/Oxa1 family membrane protein insertase
MDDQTKNLILASALSFGVILIWFTFFPPPEADPNAPAAIEQVEQIGGQEVVTTPSVDGQQAVVEPDEPVADNAPRLSISTPSLEGSISLKGGRIDELSLRNYRETLAEDSPIVKLLSPIGSKEPYYALFGWAPGGGLSADMVPGPNTIWSVDGNDKLTPDTPVTLIWDNSR